MKKNLILILLISMITIVGWLIAAAPENHGVTLSWTATTTTCTSPCVGGYNVFEGPSTGQESTTPLNSSLVTGTSYTDDGSTMNSFLGTTRCYVLQYQETINSLVLTSVNSNEICFSFPSQPAPPTSVSGTLH